MSTATVPKFGPSRSEEPSVQSCRRDQASSNRNCNQADEASHITGVNSLLGKCDDEETGKNKKQNSDNVDDPIEEATPKEEHPKLASKIVSTPKSKIRGRESEKEKQNVTKHHLATLFKRNALFAKTIPPPVQKGQDDDYNLELIDIKHTVIQPCTGDTVSFACQQMLAKNTKSAQYIKDCQNVITNWNFLFGDSDYKVLISRAACCAMAFQTTMCYAITALRILTYAPWTDAHMKDHLREVALCAIANGWTHATQNVTVGGKRVTVAEVSIAISSYENKKVFPPCAVSDLDQTVLEVSSDLFEDHIAEFFPHFNFECFSCCNRLHSSVKESKLILFIMRRTSLKSLRPKVLKRTFNAKP